MRIRTISGFIYIAITAFCMIFCDASRLIYVAFLAVVACHEVVSQTKTKRPNVSSWQGFAFIAVFAIVDIAGLYFERVTFDFVLFGLLAIMMLTFIQKIMLHKMDFEDYFVSIGICIYPVLPIMMIFHICCIKSDYWVSMLLLPFLAVVLCDTFALLTGMLFGKHKMAPTISPKKTVEGLIGGLIFAAIAGVVVYYVFTLILPMFGLNLKVPVLGFCIICGIIAGITGVFGDLAASAIKRDLGIKDFGNIIPGHGGIMDRIDSAMFGIAAVYIAYYIGYIFR